MFLTRAGSLNALEQTGASEQFWQDWLGTELPSADTLGRVMDQVDPETLRAMIREVYTRLKRNKALAPTTHGLTALVIDGHEIHSTYLRRCEGNLERRIKKRSGYQTQYYHRQVSAMLLCGDFPLLLDAEMLSPGDDEIAAAKRLLERILKDYPRAFDIVLGDALYSDPGIFKLLTDRSKDVLSVLKKNQPDLLGEAETLMVQAEPSLDEDDGTQWKTVHDLGGFEHPSSSFGPLRIVRSREGRKVRRQIDGRHEEVMSQWYWLTTCSQHRVPHQAIVALGHARWDIENQGFNETVNQWHADHIYKHTTRAILNFWLMTMLSFNLFHAFYFRNIHQQTRRRYSRLHISKCLASTLYTTRTTSKARPP